MEKIVQGYYSKKKRFIIDFVKQCRNNRNNGITYSSYMVTVCDEMWEFTVVTSYCGVSTECKYFGKILCYGSHVNLHNPVTVYPLTAWGDSKKRWDTDLKEFLEREVCKV